MNPTPWSIKFSALHKRVEAFTKGYRQNIAILGSDTEEISYLLEDYLRSNKTGDIVYLHTTTVYTGKREFFKALAYSLLSDYLQRADSFASLLNQASFLIKDTTDFIKGCLKKDDLSFLDVLEVINKFINESGKTCVLIIEEFVKLRYMFKGFYQDFSKFIILQRSCMIVLTTSDSKEAEKILCGELNLLFGNFEKVSLNDNIFLDNFFYFRNRIAAVSPSPLFISFFIHHMGSNLIYYDLMAKVVQEYYSSESEEDSMVTVMEKTLYPGETYFSQKFLKKIEGLDSHFKDPVSVTALLIALGEGYLRKKELVSLGIYDSKELSSRLQRLIDLNYVENLGNIYKIKDPLFSFWLIAIFKLKFSIPILDPKKRRAFYHKKMREEISLFKDEFLKDKVKKIMQLFSAFKNDQLRLGRRRYRLPSIERTRIMSYPHKNFHLLVGEGSEIIFAGVKENAADENDISDFIEKGLSIRNRSVKKIFISLGDLSPAVKLIAKNNKIIIWDVNDVNQLLNIYNKSSVLAPKNYYPAR